MCRYVFLLLGFSLQHCMGKYQFCYLIFGIFFGGGNIFCNFWRICGVIFGWFLATFWMVVDTVLVNFGKVFRGMFTRFVWVVFFVNYCIFYCFSFCFLNHRGKNFSKSCQSFLTLVGYVQIYKELYVFHDVCSNFGHIYSFLQGIWIWGQKMPNFRPRRENIGKTSKN